MIRLASTAGGLKIALPIAGLGNETGTVTDEGQLQQEFSSRWIKPKKSLMPTPVSAGTAVKARTVKEALLQIKNEAKNMKDVDSSVGDAGTQPGTHSLTHLLTHSLIGLLTHSLAYSLAY
jgi:hypothetical protein